MGNLITQKCLDFCETYKYQRGPVFIDGWRSAHSAPHKGDCDDFAWSVLLCQRGGVAGSLWALVTFQAVFWLVNSPSNGLLPRHVVLWQRGLGWADSLHPRNTYAKTCTGNTKVAPIPWPWAIFRIAWGRVYSVVAG